MKPSLHVDEFESQMGDNDDIIVLSFFVRCEDAAKDLTNWFEKGYDYVLDADRSPGEISPGRYLVYVELRRRSSAGRHLEEMLTDMNTLTEFEPDDWVVHYKDGSFPFTREEFETKIPLSPKAYRKRYGDEEEELNEMRIASGLQPVTSYDKKDPLLQAIRSAAGY